MKAYFYGDSNTYGYDPRGIMGGRYPEEYRWPDMLMGMFPEWTIVSDGMNGRCIPADDRSFQFLEKDLLKEAPINAFAVMLGTNDLLNQWEPDTYEIESNMETFCGKVSEVFKEQAEPADCYIITPPKLMLSGSDGDKYNAEMSMLCDKYTKLAEKVGWKFIDTRGVELSMAFDGIHLTENGHKALAKVFAEQIFEGRDKSDER